MRSALTIKAAAPKVFVSYAHESAAHTTTVLRFATFLRNQSIDATLDAWFTDARQDWYVWMIKQMSEADYIIVIASRKYRQTGDGSGDGREHRGVQSEAALLRELVYADRARWLPKVLPVLLPGHQIDEIPLFLQPHTASRYPVAAFTPSGADDLLRVIRGQPVHIPPPVVAQPSTLPASSSLPAAGPAHEFLCSPLPRQLPLAIWDFVGRTGYLAALDTLATTGSCPPESSARLVIVDGTAGVGKTTLAVWWAHRVQHRFPDGTLFVNLRGHGPETPLDPSQVVTSFLNALGVPDERIPADIDAQASMYRSLLVGRQVLVVLDNAASAYQVRPLLPSSPGCLVLVTSRTSLTGLSVTEAADRITVDLLTQAEAEDLMRQVIGERAVAEPDALTELVNMCARLPLALRVIASRIAIRQHLDLADVVADMATEHARLDGLSIGDDERSVVRAVFDWSYLRLPTEQARIFRRLGLHPGVEFALPAAAAFSGLDLAAARRHLEALVDAHLIESLGRRRYRCHDLLHIYAAHRADRDDVPGDRWKARTVGLTWYGRIAAAADRLVFPAHPSLRVDLGLPADDLVILTDRSQAWAWLTTEQATLLTALRDAAGHNMHAVTIMIAAAMRFLALRPRTHWIARLEAESLGLAAARTCRDKTAEVVFLRRRADTHQMLGRWAESDADLDSTVALALTAGDPVLHGQALCGLGRNRKLQHRYAEAQTYYEEALPLVHGTGYVEAVVECNLSQINAQLGHYQRALDHAERELTIRRDCGDLMGEAYALHNMAVARQRLGDHDRAIDLGEHAITVYRTAAATEQYVARALETVAISLADTGNRVRAVQNLTTAATILADSDDPHVDVVRDRLLELTSGATVPDSL